MKMVKRLIVIISIIFLCSDALYAVQTIMLGNTDGTPPPAVGKTFAYFGTYQSPGRVVKVRLSDFTIVGTNILSAGNNSLNTAVVDSAFGAIYFGTVTNPGRIVKVATSDLSEVNTLILVAITEINLHSSLISSGFAYFGTFTNPGRVIKVDTPTFSKVGTLTLNIVGTTRGAVAAGLDVSNNMAYFSSSMNPAEIGRINLSTFTHTGTLVLAAGDYGGTYNESILVYGGHLYLPVCDTPNKSIVKVSLATFTKVAELDLPPADSLCIYTAVLDDTNGIAYFGTSDWGGNAKVYKVDLPSFSVVGAPLTVTIRGTYSAVIDTINGFAYFGGQSVPPGRVSKVRLSDFSEVGVLTFGAGFGTPYCAAIE